MASKTAVTAPSNGKTAHEEAKLPKGMIRLDFSGPMLDNRGKIGKSALWEPLNDFLASEMKPNQGSKLYGWQKQLQGGGVILLDESDYNTLKEMVKSTGRLQSFAQGQLEEIINEAKK